MLADPSNRHGTCVGSDVKIASDCWCEKLTLSLLQMSVQYRVQVVQPRSVQAFEGYRESDRASALNISTSVSELLVGFDQP